MDQPGEIEFTVDEQYENEKGIFTVISIHRGQMVIRWEDGEEIRTDIEFQRRIAERRHWEKHNVAAETGTAGRSSRKSAAARKKSEFAGFVTTDFKKSAQGTTWRSRRYLGEAITEKIQTARFTFKSWAFAHKPEMHVQDIKHHGSPVIDFQAKFFVRVDQQALYYGFLVARPVNTVDTPTDWEAFTGWLAREENEQMLRQIAAEEQLTVCNNQNPASGILSAADDGWRINEGGQQPGKETLTAYINEIPETEPLDLEIAATVAKDDAVASGVDIAPKIAQLFTRLLPLYQAAEPG